MTVSMQTQRYWTPGAARPHARGMIVITTPTGAIGSQVLRLLLDTASTHGEPLRVVARDPGRLPGDVRERIDVVAGSQADAAVVERALDGADALFWLPPPDRHAASLDEAFVGVTRAVARALPASGVTHVVGVSALGRGTPVAGRAGQVTASLAMDDLLGSTGVAYRALANPSFMDNLLRQVVAIRDHGVFTDTVHPERRAPMVATRDIAARAVDLLLDRSWTGVAEVPLLGPEDLSPEDLARTMGEVLGRPVRYQRQSLEDLAAAMTGYGASAAFAEGMVDMMAAKEAGLDDGVERTPDTTGRTTFRAWCAEVLAPAVTG